jgi:hypothetical protein
VVTVTDAMAHLEFPVRALGGLAVVAVPEELDITNSGGLVKVLTAAIDDHRIRMLLPGAPGPWRQAD